ncbi:hypothetical protein EKO04_010125 [Ascochyta lentis]|uniref:Uncharacterized protein n=1 Tax=Ascochyta lentis TaxID=205686 RepID=A0A8H7IUX4_9PLEO|nr:hypothetical protein EKO04_010125 [Ascochyta lentis]
MPVTAILNVPSLIDEPNTAQHYVPHDIQEQKEINPISTKIAGELSTYDIHVYTNATKKPVVPSNSSEPRRSKANLTIGLELFNSTLRTTRI